MTDAWKLRCRTFWKEWAKPLLIILIVGCSLRSAIADWNYVPTGSMKPTILEGDRIFVNRLAYDLKVPFTTWHILEWGEPRRGDVVVLYSPEDGKLLVKRVIGLPGDTISLRDNRLFVNGEPAEYEPLEEEVENEIASDERPDHDFARERVGTASHPVMITPSRWNPSSTFDSVSAVPPGEFFVMGDNRDNSKDSRSFGSVDRRSILGRAVATAISVDPERHYLPRWHRFFRSLP
jgi:signal peptidase I